MAGGAYADYAAWDSQDGGGGAAYAFIEAQPQVSRDEHTLPAAPQPQKKRVPQMSDQQHFKQQSQTQSQGQSQAQLYAQAQSQAQSQPQVQTSNAYNGSLSSAQADADRQMMFLQMQEHLQMQQDTRSGWMDRCWQRRRDVMKLAVMALVVLLALSTHSVAVHYLKTYVEGATLSEWRELFIRVAYPASVLLVLWAIKGAQAQAQTRGSGA